MREKKKEKIEYKSLRKTEEWKKYERIRLSWKEREREGCGMRYVYDAGYAKAESMSRSCWQQLIDDEREMKEKEMIMKRRITEKRK